MRSRRISLGNFQIMSGALFVCDPCYKPDTWCARKLTKVKNGMWSTTANQVELGEWGKPITKLSIKHERAPARRYLKKHKCNFVVGVDSGQAGFFDADHFHDASVFSEPPQKSLSNGEDPWYDHCCCITLSPTHAGVIPFGAVSESGTGDGCYAGYYYTDAFDHVLIAEIVYLTKKDLEAYEDG